jgi:hypothetical protein
MNYQIDEDLLKITLKKKETKINYDSPIILNIVESIKDLITSLQNNDFNWRENNNTLIFNIISKCIIFINKYKNISIEEKKEICLKLIEKLIDREVNKLDISSSNKVLLQDGIDTIIEPIIELALLTALNKIKLKDSCLSCLKRK